MKTGFYVSGGAHGALVLWAVIGGVFQTPPDAGLRVSQVSVISEQQFAALSSPAAGGAPDAPAEAPVAPTAPEPSEAPDPPAEDTTPSVPEPVEETTPPEADPTPDLSALTDPLPETEVTPEAPPAPTAPETPEGAALTLAPDRAPVPRRAPRIAPEPVPAPETDASDSEALREAALPEPAETPPTPQPDEPPTAPEEAVTRTEPDAKDVDSGGTSLALAPTGSPRPQARPRRPAPSTANDGTADQTDAVAAAVADAAATSPGQGDGGTGTARQGPPLTSGEKDALRLAVQRCWNVGSLSSEALRTTVTLFIKMTPDGKPDTGSIRLIESSNGAGGAAQQAFEAARRAVIRCGASGFDLPQEKYGQWQEIEMVFNPDSMRLR